jgi:branched-chain amino acid transport system substrate-binding protein
VPRRPAALLAAVVVLAAAAWAGAQTRPAGPAQIAILLPLSGDYAHVGHALLDAMQLALADASGVSWTVLDTRGDAARAGRLTEQLADDPGVVAVVGPVGAAESRTAAEVAGRRGLPMLSLSSQAGVEGAGGYVFRLRVAPEDQARQMARVALNDLELHRFAVLYPDDPVGRSAMAAFVDEVLRGGGSVTALEAYDPESTNLLHPVELVVDRRDRVVHGRAFESPPRASERHRSERSRVDFEALFIPDEGDRVALVLPFLSFVDVALGTRVRLLGLSSWADGDLAVSGDLAAGALFTRIYDEHMEDPGAAHFADVYRDRYQRTPSEAEAQAYDAVAFLVEVLAGVPAGGTDRAGLRQALQAAPPFAGLGSPLQLDRAGAVVRDLPLFSVDRSGYAGPYELLR